MSKKHQNSQKIPVEQIWIEQYRRCCEDFRHYDKLLWEVPFSTLTITGSLLALSFAWIRETYLRAVIIFCLFVFVIMMMFVAVKARFFQEVRCEFARKIEKKLGGSETPVETEESKEYLREKTILLKNPLIKGMVSVRAFYLQMYFYFSIIILLAFLLASHILDIILNII